MGSRGPIPKRDAERRRQNRQDRPTDRITITGKVRVPTACREWHPLAKSWYRSLRTSGQAKFYEASDWATAKYTAELMSRLLVSDRVSAQLVASLNSLMAALMVTEGDRRRVRLEIERLPDEPIVPAEVAVMDDYRKSLGG